MNGWAFVTGCLVFGLFFESGCTNIARAIQELARAYREREE